MALRKIVGFHLDESGDWVAELECGHGATRAAQTAMDDAAWVRQKRDAQSISAANSLARSAKKLLTQSPAKRTGRNLAKKSGVILKKSWRRWPFRRWLHRDNQFDAAVFLAAVTVSFERQAAFCRIRARSWRFREHLAERGKSRTEPARCSERR